MTRPDAPAFPEVEYFDEKPIDNIQGLTVREKFAETAMSAMLSNPEFTKWNADEIAEESLIYADKLIEALNK